MWTKFVGSTHFLMTTRFDSEEIQELVIALKEVKEIIQNVGKSPDNIILDDVDVQNFFKISKRTIAYWREKGEITYSKLGGRIFYRLSDILSLIKRHEI
jgi:DNA-binding transcriptional MerR regulator